MTTAIAPLTPRHLDRTALVFHALSDATRLRIIARLAGGERCVCELTDALDASQSRLSFHLRTLKDAGLVSDRREGRWAYYTLNPEAFAECSALLANLGVAAKDVKAGCCGVKG